ncbi:hypothetical protein BDW02DRAFT_569464 [Decorospora gaudefroyi]|uniref:F-box domain-containing protein n=1 Tax=Decorospora gaudefroyi TaxID=184978 RepID=A0A6A5KEJ1_9PLEO|nr:hypothetical protein BDW02DRAFT_569464 [Decorospora gaudefroyi]
MIEAVGSKSGNKTAGTKRAAGNSESRLPQKRQKTKDIPEPAKQPEHPWAVDPDQVFRFTDLPGELRNRIYEVAAEWSYRWFPPTFLKPKKTRRGKSTSCDEDRTSGREPLPHLGLTQTCTLIRTEFRPLWLSTNRFPLYVLDGYFKAFFPAPLRASQTAAEVRTRIATYYNPAGNLRLWINKVSLADIDVLQLLKFSNRFPAYKFTVKAGLPVITPKTVASITALVENKNSTWIKHIKQHIITQVRIKINDPNDDDRLHVVIKESHAPKWAKSYLGLGHTRRRAKYWGASVGLGDAGWYLTVGVDYS